MSKVFVNKQQPGSIYISSPTGFIHGVDYPTSPYSDRVVAVQCRLLMTKVEFYRMFEIDQDEWFRIIAKRVTPVLQRAELRMPTLSQARAALGKLTG